MHFLKKKNLTWNSYSHFSTTCCTQTQVWVLETPLLILICVLTLQEMSYYYLYCLVLIFAMKRQRPEASKNPQPWFFFPNNSFISHSCAFFNAIHLNYFTLFIIWKNCELHHINTYICLLSIFSYENDVPCE